MTGVEQIKDRILSDADAYAKEHIRTAVGKAEKILEDARTRAEEKKAHILEEAEREAADTGRRMIAFADMEIKKEKLRVKRQVVEKAFEMAIEKLCGMSRDKYVAIMANRAAASAGGEKAEVMLSARDRDLLGEILMARINFVLRNLGKQQAEISLSGYTPDIRGGFILKTGDIEMNFSFEALLRANREELEELAYSMLNIR